MSTAAKYRRIKGRVFAGCASGKLSTSVLRRRRRQVATLSVALRWWRRGRVELPVQKVSLVGIYVRSRRDYFTCCGHFRRHMASPQVAA